MATYFYDDFARADGAPGNGWGQTSTGWRIESGELVCTATGFQRIYHAANLDSDNQEVIVYLGAGFAPHNNVNFEVALQFVAANPYGYLFNMRQTTGNTALLRVFRPGASVTLHLDNKWTLSAGAHELRFQLLNGLITVACDGFQVCQAYDASYRGINYVGLSMDGNSVSWSPHIAAVEVWGGAQGRMYAVPSHIPMDSVDTCITVSTEGTPWTPGTPGSPDLQVSQGTKVSQQVISNWQAYVYYTPGLLPGTVTIRDPNTGNAAQLGLGGVPDISPYDAVQLSAGAVGGSGGELTDTYYQALATGGISPSTFLAVLEFLYGLLTPGGSTTCDFSALSGYTLQDPPLKDDVQAIFDQGSVIKTEVYEEGGASTTLRDKVNNAISSADAANTKLSTLATPGNLTLQSVIDQLAGGGHPTHADIISALGGTLTVDLSAVMAELAAIRTPANYTLLDLITQWTAFRTASNYTVADILSAIGGVRGSGNPDIAAVLTAIANIQVQAPDLSPILLAISNHDTNLQNAAVTIINEINQIPTNPITSLQPVLDAIANIPVTPPTDLTQVNAKLDAILAKVNAKSAPVWPGLANVTYQAPHAISNGLTVTTPLDGLICNLTSVPTSKPTYAFGAYNSHSRIGHVAFFDDAGHFEQAQSFGFDTYVIVPNRMHRAAGFVVRCNAATAGTLTPWTAT